MCQNDASNNGLCQPCGLYPFKRNRYFEGKLLVPRDFQAEQSYLRGKDRLHSSLLHGTGTVCGLKIEEHPNPACRHQYVVLNPGLALDCCGNEIVVPEQKVVDLCEAIETALRAAGRFLEEGEPEPINVYVRLAYWECDTEPVPALLDDCGCNETNVEFNRTKESYHLFVDLDDPISEVTEPFDARLEWQHTLSVAHPQAIVVDHDLMRLYVAEFDGTEGWLRMYDASNHSQLARVRARAGLRDARQPTALARSNLGDYIYVAIAPGATVKPYIAIFDQNLLKTDPDSAAVALLSVPDWPEVDGLPNVVRLSVSGRDDSLFALIDDGRILRWSSDAIRTWVADDGAGIEPLAVTQYLHNATADSKATTVRPNDITLSFDGRWLVVADGADAQLIVVNLSQFDTPVPLGGDVSNLMEAHALPAGDVPSVVEFSYDGAFLYVLCGDSQMLYRIEVRNILDTFIPDIPDEGNAFSAVRLADPAADHPPEPIDISVSPRDNWLYVLRRLLDNEGHPRDRGEILILSVDAINERRGPDTYDLETTPEIDRGSVNIIGDALFQNLAFLGQRLYASAEEVDPSDPLQGSISILYIDEAACNTFIHRTLEGCPTCADPGQGVILASIQNYEWNEPMVEDESTGPNVIDNLTHRQMVPSTNTLRQVIECMLEKGFSEGVPGPRGAPGPRGLGIVEASATALDSGELPTAGLVPIPGDVEGDQRLNLGIPRGQDGDPGPRGPGITDVSVTTCDPGTGATASLEPIPGDPEGDQRLLLGIPRGASIVEVELYTPDTGTADAELVPIDPGNPDGDQRLILTIPIPTVEPLEPEEFNQVVNASWHHDEVLTPDDFGARFSESGLVIAFKQKVRTDTLHWRSAFLLARRRDESYFACDCVMDMNVEPVTDIELEGRKVRWLIGNEPQPQDDNFELVGKAATATDSDFADGVRLVPLDDLTWKDLVTPRIGESEIERLTVVLRGDWILDERGRGLDGNHIWPGVPEEPTAAGPYGRFSGNGTEGGDWISIIHIDLGQFG